MTLEEYILCMDTALERDHGIQLQCESERHAKLMRWGFYRARQFHRLIPEDRKYRDLKFSVRGDVLRLINRKGVLERQDPVQSPLSTAPFHR